MIALSSQRVTKETEDKKACFLPWWPAGVCLPHCSLWSCWQRPRRFRVRTERVSSSTPVITGKKRIRHRTIPRLLSLSTDTGRAGKILVLATSKTGQVLVTQAESITHLPDEEKWDLWAFCLSSSCPSWWKVPGPSRAFMPSDRAHWGLSAPLIPGHPTPSTKKHSKANLKELNFH